MCLLGCEHLHVSILNNWVWTSDPVSYTLAFLSIQIWWKFLFKACFVSISYNRDFTIPEVFLSKLVSSKTSVRVLGLLCFLVCWFITPQSFWESFEGWIMTEYIAMQHIYTFLHFVHCTGANKIHKNVMFIRLTRGTSLSRVKTAGSISLYNIRELWHRSTICFYRIQTMCAKKRYQVSGIAQFNIPITTLQCVQLSFATLRKSTLRWISTCSFGDGNGNGEIITRVFTRLIFLLSHRKFFPVCLFPGKSLNFFLHTNGKTQW